MINATRLFQKEGDWKLSNSFNIIINFRNKAKNYSRLKMPISVSNTDAVAGLNHNFVPRGPHLQPSEVA